MPPGRTPTKTRVIGRVVTAGAAATLGLWTLPPNGDLLADLLAGLGAPAAAFAINGPTCGPGNDGMTVKDTAGVTWQCTLTSPGVWQWVQVH